MPSKKPQRSAIYFYMLDLQEKVRKQGITFKKLFPDLLDYASPRWKALTPEQKAPFERQYKEWKAERNSSLVGKMDSQGNLLTETLRQQEESERWQREMVNAIKSLVYAHDTTEAVADLKFYIISFNIFCQTEKGDVVPAEFGMVEFSLKDGITKELHKFIHPGKIPQGYLFDCQKSSEATHQIPPERFEEADEDYEGIYQAMLNFINPNRKFEAYPKIFCLPHEILIAMKIFDWINEGGNSRNRELVLEAYDLGLLVTCLQNFAAEKTEDIGNITRGLVMDALQTSMFDHTPNISCGFHEEKDLTKYCALAQSKKHVFRIVDILGTLYKISFVPGKHLPSSSSDFGATVVTYPPINVKPAPDSFTERRKLVQPTTSTIVHGVRSRFAADDYDDSVRVESAMQNLSINSSRPSTSGWSNIAAPCPPPRQFDLDTEDFPDLGSRPAARRGYASAVATQPEITRNPALQNRAEVNVPREDLPLRLPRSRPADLPTGRGLGRGVPPRT